MSALPPKADIGTQLRDVRFAIRRRHTLYTRSVNWCNFIVELPAGHADFREIKGSDCAPGGRATLKQIDIGSRTLSASRKVVGQCHQTSPRCEA
jgi:hypothetical protein